MTGCQARIRFLLRGLKRGILSRPNLAPTDLYCQNQKITSPSECALGEVFKWGERQVVAIPRHLSIVDLLQTHSAIAS